jgi:hypothetical protein
MPYPWPTRITADSQLQIIPGLYFHSLSQMLRAVDRYAYVMEALLIAIYLPR